MLAATFHDNQFSNTHTVGSHDGKKVSGFRIPWVGRQDEMKKCITIEQDGKILWWIFQNWNSSDGQEICGNKTKSYSGAKHLAQGSGAFYLTLTADEDVVVGKI